MPNLLTRRALKLHLKIFIFSFSNRLFIDKAVAIWTGKSDIDHISIVGDYFHYSGGAYDAIRAIDITPSVNIKIGGDPLYIVVSSKNES